MTIAVRMSARFGILLLRSPQSAQGICLVRGIRQHVEAGDREDSFVRRVVRRVVRILVLALPVAALMGFLAFQRGIGWHNPDCVFTRTHVSCDWSWLHPLFWGPWPYRIIEYPSGLGLVPAVLWWLFVGLLAAIPVEWWLRRRLSARHRPAAG
jgi:hypothetical protein